MKESDTSVSAALYLVGVAIEGRPAGWHEVGDAETEIWMWRSADSVVCAVLAPGGCVSCWREVCELSVPPVFMPQNC